MVSQAQKGVTILEMMLVMAIAGTLIVLGIKWYEGYEENLMIHQLIYNVDQLFQATGNYYQANCAYGSVSPNPPNYFSPYTNVTNQGISYPPTSYYPVSISSNLVVNGYLNNWYPENALVNPSGADAGYVVQLNPVTSTQMSVNACIPFPPGINTQGTACVPSPAVLGPSQSQISSTYATVVYWKIQVAVEINDLSKIEGYLPALGADCISGVSSGSSPPTVDACPSANPNKNYVVWTRPPSFAAIQQGSVFSSSMQVLKQFNLQYTHDPNYEFNKGISLSNRPVYYNCGG